MLVPFLDSQVVSVARAQSDHRLRWRTIETPSFHIHYHEPLGLWARALAAEAEAINVRVGGALGLRLREPVELVLADDNDAANGFAQATPYNTIRLRVASPDDMSPLADYDDWPTTLLTHEHTHVLHLEEASGVPQWLRSVFGRFYTPQGSLPGWFVEGLAVVEESRHTSGGRVRGSLFDMYLRMDALDDRVRGIDWIGFDGEPWPHGNLRYLYGQGFVEFLRQRFGEEGLGAFIREYGRRLVPYGLNRALKRATGQTFVALYDEFVSALRTRSRQVQARVEAQGRVEGTRLTFHGELTRTPRFVSSDTLVYTVSDARHVPDVRKLALRTGAHAQRLVRTASVGQATRVPGTTRVVYSANTYHRGVYTFSDLFAVDLEGAHHEQLTHALRAREPDVSPDGKRIAYVTQAAGTSHLEVAELADIERTRLMVVQSRRLEQVFTPRWSPDGRHIAYSAFSRGGYRDLWLLDVASGARTRLTYDRAIDRGPVFSADGRALYFSSDRSGIANLYRLELTSGAQTQLTNVVGGAFQPDLSPDGRTLVYVGYGSLGFDLYTLALDAAPPGAVPAAHEVTAPERPPVRALPVPAPLRSTSYQPLYTLWPRYYELGLDDAGNGNRLLLTTSGADAVGFHAWSLRVGSLLSERDVTVDAAYTYRQARFPIIAYGSLRDHDRYDLVVNERRLPWQAHEASLGIGTVFVFPAPLRTLRLRLDYTTSVLQQASSFDTPYLDPNYQPPSRPPLGFDTRAYWSVTHSTAQRQPFDISTSWGHTMTLAGSFADRVIGSRQRDWGLSMRAEQFVRFSFRESVLALAYTGAFRTPTSLGGYPSQLAPLRDALVGTRSAPGDYARLRGFPLRGGDMLSVLQLEYRVLLSRINRGVQTLPVFARRIHGALFVDAGDVWDRRTQALTLARIGVGLGAELRLDWASHYGSNYTLRGGVAQGITRGGQLQWYTTLATPF
jgi:Tol biopolymer transport system component